MSWFIRKGNGGGAFLIVPVTTILVTVTAFCRRCNWRIKKLGTGTKKTEVAADPSWGEKVEIHKNLLPTNKDIIMLDSMDSMDTFYRHL